MEAPTISSDAAMTSVPPLSLSVCTPRTSAERIALYTPRTSLGLYSPRTHREQLDLTGSQLSEALEAAAEIAKRVHHLSTRAAAARADFVAKAQTNADANQTDSCPICMEQLASPLACANEHKFCGECLRAYRRSCPDSPRLLCPLCRVAMPHYQKNPWDDAIVTPSLTGSASPRSPRSPALRFGMR